MTFDRRGRIVTVCVSVNSVTLRLLDPTTLATLAEYRLPARGLPTSPNFFQDFSGGGYFYLDDQDRAVIPTADRRILVVGETAAPGFRLVRSYSIAAGEASGDKTVATMPDWKGRIWFVTKAGNAGWIDPATVAVHVRDLGAEIANSFAVDESGSVYVVTNEKLFRLEAGGPSGVRTVWSLAYANDGTQKPGQSQAGSGTTPTVMGKRWIAITNNADPVRVVVVRKGRTVKGRRTVCSVPVFAKGASSTDQSLIAAGRAIFAENNFGYTGPTTTENGVSTAAGLERVDVRANGKGCVKRWHSDEHAPTVVPKVSLDGGLLYTYTKPPGDPSDPWYLTALDARTGRTAFKALAGRGLGFNNNYAPVTLGPDGTAYVGTLGGLVALRDATPPRLPATPRLTLRAACRKRTVKIRVGGIDEPLVVRARLLLGGGDRLDRSSPFSLVVRRHGHRIFKARVRARLRDGRRPLVRRTVRCPRG